MPRGENRPSILLSRDENEQVFSLIGPKCQSLATAVVQLFTTEGPGHSEWKKKDTGVLCLIKDNGKRSYFFRIYCLYRRAMIWEHEVYLQIEYKSPRSYLHTFEAEEYMTAFNFANEDEAQVLRNILIEKIELRKTRREDRRQRSMMAARANSVSSTHSSVSAVSNVTPRHNGALPPPPPPAAEPAPPPPPKTPNITGTYTLKSNKKKVTKKITKADISLPSDFKHISHVGWDAHKGFDVETTQPNEELLSFFNMAGISDKQLQDQETREFIYSFIESHGGIDAVKEDLHTSNAKPTRNSSRAAVPSPVCAPPAPPAPPAAPPVPQRSPAPPHPPAPPSRAPPPPPARAVPPPPPPVSVPRNPPPPRPLQPPTTGPPSVPPPPPPGVAPPPPPPPPPAPAPPAAPPPPPAPPTATDTAASADPRAALMESIRNGNKTLKRVEVAAKPAPVEDSRSNLLSEIRQGIELRSVSRSGSTGASSAPAGPEPCGLAGALARALQERSRAIHSDSDSDLSEETSDGEWDD